MQDELSQSEGTTNAKPSNSADVHLQMFAGHDKGRERRMENGRYLADVLFPLFKPKTVIDLGCGLGFFLRAMADYGSKISAVDNEWVKSLAPAIPLEDYTFHDLNEPFSTGKRFGLATSFEVAEHLVPERSEDFVKELCSLSNQVAFGAAIPGQGGSGHINLRWQSQWAELFAAQGYRCYDAIRPRMAEREAAYFWFRQNTLLFIKDGAPVPASIKATAIEPRATIQISRNFHNRRLRNANITIKRLRDKIKQLEGKS